MTFADCLKFEELMDEELVNIMVAAAIELKKRETEEPPKAIVPKKRKKYTLSKPRKPREKTEEQIHIDEFIKENYSKMSVREMADDLKIDKKTIYNRIQKMGLRKPEKGSRGKPWKENPADKGDQPLAVPADEE